MLYLFDPSAPVIRAEALALCDTCAPDAGPWALVVPAEPGSCCYLGCPERTDLYHTVGRELLDAEDRWWSSICEECGEVHPCPCVDYEPVDVRPDSAGPWSIHDLRGGR